MATTSPTCVLIADSFDDSGISQLQSIGCEVRCDSSLQEESLVAAIQEFNPTVLIVRSTKVSAAMIGSTESLALIVRAGAGFDMIDLSEASKRGVFVANCPEKNSIAVAELAWGLILSCDRRIPNQTIRLREGRWEKKAFSKTRGLYGRTLGVIGLGGIGREVVKRAKAFGMDVIAWSRSLNQDKANEWGIQWTEDINELANASDVVSVHAASTPETKHIINAAFLDSMKDGSILINTSRGALIDEEALCKAVEEKNLLVGLDVFKNEPSSGSSEFSPRIATFENVFGTHHVGASTAQSQQAIASEAVRVVKHYCDQGEVYNCVNRAVETPAKSLLSVRHQNLPGVLAHVFELLSHAGVNVEEMENIMYDGAHAACARIQLSEEPNNEQLEAIRSHEHVLSTTLTPLS
ncbi:MAG: NAD(P)-dependent oxidoreductase [Planctomycetota bacterium]|nr:NAD(P)-dependent oxidoreductase [Planctomycetota bacterium]